MVSLCSIVLFYLAEHAAKARRQSKGSSPIFGQRVRYGYTRCPPYLCLQGCLLYCTYVCGTSATEGILFHMHICALLGLCSPHMGKGRGEIDEFLYHTSKFQPYSISKSGLNIFPSLRKRVDRRMEPMCVCTVKMRSL